MEELYEVMERKKALRCGAMGIGAIVLLTWGVGAWWGAREYRQYGDAVTAEQHIDATLSDSTPERLAYYGTWPGRKLGYWLASR